MFKTSGADLLCLNAQKIFICIVLLVIMLINIKDSGIFGSISFSGLKQYRYMIIHDNLLHNPVELLN